MEWTKIKPKHFIYTDYSLANKGCLITLLCLTAHLERMPTFKEMSKVVYHKSITRLEVVMKSSGSCLEVLLNKVLEDCTKVEHKKDVSRETSKRYRESLKNSDTSCDTTEKIREDKIRLDKSRVDKEKNNENPYVAFEQATFTSWNNFCNDFPKLSKIQEITPKRRSFLKNRFMQKSFKDFDSILKAIKEQPFLLGKNDREWKVSFDWIISNDTNYVKILERKYKNDSDISRKIFRDE